MACMRCHKHGRNVVTIVVSDSAEGGVFRLVICLECKGAN
jgi:hypothetical protein